MSKSRERLLEMVEDGMLDPMDALRMCANWMTNQDVADMLESNGFDEEEEDYV